MISPTATASLSSPRHPHQRSGPSSRSGRPKPLYAVVAGNATSTGVLSRSKLRSEPATSRLRPWSLTQGVARDELARRRIRDGEGVLHAGSRALCRWPNLPANSASLRGRSPTPSSAGTPCPPTVTISTSGACEASMARGGAVPHTPVRPTRLLDRSIPRRTQRSRFTAARSVPRAARRPM